MKVDLTLTQKELIEREIMMPATVHLGYEIGSGERVDVPVRHLAVTGQTQESGKTTTLEALITRSGLRAVAFITKRGERSFRVTNPVPAYFRQPMISDE